MNKSKESVTLPPSASEMALWVSEAYGLDWNTLTTERKREMRERHAAAVSGNEWQPPSAGETAHTLQSCNLVGMRADRSSSRRNPGMESPFFADIVTDTDLLAHVRGDSYTEAEARRAFIVRACNSHAELLAWKDAAIVRSDKLHAINAGLVAALEEIAKEKCAVGNGWDYSRAALIARAELAKARS
jgi:hypothetical protein